MSLKLWEEYGWILPEPSSKEEIADLQGLIRRALKDSQVTAISDDLRFQAAFHAMLSAANAALRASGYRTRVQLGHHQKLIESMELTLAADAKIIQKLRVFSRKRNSTSYDTAGGVSEQELSQAIALAQDLQLRLETWLGMTHPELCAKKA